MLADQLRAYALRPALMGFGVVALGIVGGHLIANRAIRAIANAGRRIASANWEEQIPPGGAPDELEELRNVLNETLTRQATAYYQQRRFTSVRAAADSAAAIPAGPPPHTTTS